MQPAMADHITDLEERIVRLGRVYIVSVLATRECARSPQETARNTAVQQELEQVFAAWLKAVRRARLTLLPTMIPPIEDGWPEDAG